MPRLWQPYSGTPEYNPTIGGSAEATLKMLSEYRFYSNPPFEGSYEDETVYGNIWRLLWTMPVWRLRIR